METKADPVQPLYLDARSHTVFAAYHGVSGGDAAGAAVLVCSPWGWDEVASYRPRRRWAQRLAEAGHPTLRFDLPGTGNSSGSAGSESLVPAWIDAVKFAAGWLRQFSGSPRIAALGIGLGGLLAMEALGSEAEIDELILWAAPLTGSSFVRGARTFSRLQSWQATPDPDGGDESLDDGWIEASGFLLSPETIAELQALRPDGGSSGRLQRALLLGRHGAFPRGPVTEQMESGGAEVEVAAAKGWGTMVSHPERSRLSTDAADRVERWLALGDPGTGGADRGLRAAQAGQPAERPSGIELDVAGEAVTEVPFTVDQPFGRTFGILTRPLGRQVPGLSALFLNAGSVRDTGPNRMWVERSRAWAADGVASLRVDLEAIGDADGDPAGLPPGDEYFSAKYESQIEAVLAALREQGLGPDFVLVGLCSGAYFAYRIALRDERVVAAVLINAGALVWRPDLLSEREARKASRVFQRRWLAKLVRGEIGWRKIGALARSLGRRCLDSLQRLIRLGAHRIDWKAELQDGLGRLRDSETRLVVAFSNGEPMQEELTAIGFADFGGWPNVEAKELPGGDHTLRPIQAQIALRELLDSELEREVARVERSAPTGGVSRSGGSSAAGNSAR